MEGGCAACVRQVGVAVPGMHLGCASCVQRAARFPCSLLATCTPACTVLQGLEKYVMSKVWRQTFGACDEDRERDERYQRLMQASGPCVCVVEVGVGAGGRCGRPGAAAC